MKYNRVLGTVNCEPGLLEVEDQLCSLVVVCQGAGHTTFNDNLACVAGDAAVAAVSFEIVQSVHGQ